VLQQTLLTSNNNNNNNHNRPHAAGLPDADKNNVHSNSIISNIDIIDEILPIAFQITHLARSLTGRRHFQ